MPNGRLPIVDSHLDLAENVTLFGRDLLVAVAERRIRERSRIGQATVSLPDLERGGIAVVLATVTAGFLAADVGANFEPRSAIYHSPKEAEGQALKQIALYEQWARLGLIRLVKSVWDLRDHLRLWESDRKPGVVMLMEGADPIVEVGDLSAWWKRGIRLIGLTFGDTRYGRGVRGGSRVFKRGGLTPEGVMLLEAMGEIGFAWDISHLTEDAIWEGLELKFPHVCASHANVQAIVPTDRQLSDAVIRAVGKQGGVIGLVLYNGFLEPRWKDDKSTVVTLKEHLAKHAQHVADLVGWDGVGIGSDLDGGFGADQVPAELDTVADLHIVGSVVPQNARDRLLGANWIRFLDRSLPKTA